jgi:hypothetical protein
VSRITGMPDIGARVPGFVPRLGLAITAGLLCAACYQPGFWLVVGLALTAFAVLLPHRLGAWLLVVFLGASQLGREAWPVSWRFLVLLAGMHLVHVLAALTLQLPWRSWVQVDVFRTPLMRFLLIQVPAQGAAALLVALLAPRSNGSRPLTLPAFGIVGAVALVGVTLLLAVPLLRERGR